MLFINSSTNEINNVNKGKFIIKYHLFDTSRHSIKFEGCLCENVVFRHLFSAFRIHSNWSYSNFIIPRKGSRSLIFFVWLYVSKARNQNCKHRSQSGSLNRGGIRFCCQTYRRCFVIFCSRMDWLWSLDRLENRTNVTLDFVFRLHWSVGVVAEVLLRRLFKALLYFSRPHLPVELLHLCFGQNVHLLVQA